MAVSLKTLKQNIAPLRLTAWRVVEYQSAIVTRPLTDTDDEQALLERLIDTAKPPAPDPQREPAFRGLHYLLATPFRYPPLRHGSRFGTRHERSLWYGARKVPTALAERAFYLFADWSLSHAPAQPTHNRFTAFAAKVRTARGIDLTAPAFARHHKALAAPDRYTASQTTGTRMRTAGVEAFVSRSARDPKGGSNVALFTPAAFATKAPDPKRVQTWSMVSDRRQITFVHAGLSRAQRLTLRVEDFEVGGELPRPVA